MSYIIDNQQKINDVIFADRNKAYGAYAIRSEYGFIVLRSLSLMLVGVGGLAVTAWLLNMNNTESGIKPLPAVDHDSTYITKFNSTPEDLPEQKNKKIPEQAQPKTNPDASTSLIVSDSIPENNATLNVTMTATGVSSVETGSDTGTESNGKEPDGKSTASVAINGIKGALEVDAEPVFEGGLKALYYFIGSHLRYPERASDDGKGGTVYVKFVVDEQGKVTDLTLLNVAGYGMDEEALRVVGLLPKFKSPAKLRGEAVKVYYQLPIRFRYK